MVSIAGENPRVLNVTIGSLAAVAVAVAVTVNRGAVTRCWLIPPPLVPSPSWPCQLYPQQYAVPPDTRPHV